MELVVDANVLLSSFLKEAITRQLLLDARLALFAPEYLITEVSRHISRNANLRKRIRLSSDELKELFTILTRDIQTVPQSSYRTFWAEALSLSPHKEDAPYFAVALLLKIPIWSNDKGYKGQSEVKVYSTADLIETLSANS